MEASGRLWAVAQLLQCKGGGGRRGAEEGRRGEGCWPLAKPTFKTQLWREEAERKRKEKGRAEKERAVKRKESKSEITERETDTERERERDRKSVV